jgi:hypothetical protein
MLDGLAVNEVIVGFVAAFATLFGPTQARKVSSIRKAPRKFGATLFRCEVPYCPFIGQETFIFHLGSMYGPIIVLDAANTMVP